MNDGIILSAADVIKSFGQTHVLRGVSLQVKRGESVAIIGKSGAGKTTLLNILGGLEVMSSGKLRFNGTELNRFNVRNYRKNNVGFVFQSCCLIDEFTVLQNVNAAIKLSNSKADATEILTLTGVEPQKRAYPAQLSGGQARRVALARALSKHPKLLLLDEPTEGLDDRTAQEITLLTETLCRKYEITTITVTHNMLLAKRASRALRLEDGMLTEESLV